MPQINYRPLSFTEIGHIAGIDRSEVIEQSYILRDGHLSLIDSPETVSGFDADEVQALIVRQQKLYNEGGLLSGAFHEDKLVGVASVEAMRRGPALSYCKMDILYLDKAYRGKGIAQELLQLCKLAAKGFGATKLYISATPTKHTVDFYMRQGAVLSDYIDPELFALEPDDIHLELGV